MEGCLRVRVDNRHPVLSNGKTAGDIDGRSGFPRSTLLVSYRFGVGLAIAERAVKLHCDELHATNRPGGGAVVSMSFPLLNEKEVE
jgi:hypothetical protein